MYDDDDIIVIGNNDKEDDEILSWDSGDSFEARHFVTQQKYVIDLWTTCKLASTSVDPNLRLGMTPH